MDNKYYQLKRNYAAQCHKEEQMNEVNIGYKIREIEERLETIESILGKILQEPKEEPKQ